MAGSVLEEHIIKIRHVSDAEGMQRARDQARKTAQEIEQAFNKAAKGAGDSADDIADDHEQAAKKTSEVWTGALRRIGERLTDFGINAARAAASYIADTFESVRETDQFARTLGVATQEMQALEKGFERARVPADNTREAVKTLRENLGELERLGTGPARDALGSLGLTLEDFKGKTPTQQIETLADALRNVEDPMKRTSIAIELMGEDGQRIMPAMLDGADGVRAFADAARDAGQVLDDETIQATRDLDTAIMDAKASAEGIALAVLTEATPALQGVTEDMRGWVDENQELIDQGVPAAIDLIASAASAAAKAVLGLAAGFQALRDEFRVNDSGSDILATFDRIEARGGRLTEAQQRQRRQILQSAANTRRRSQELQGDGASVIPEGFERVTTVGRIAGEDLPTEIQSAQNRTRSAQLFLIEQRKAEERAFRAAQQRESAAAFEAGEKAKGTGGGRRRSTGPSAEATAQAEALREELARIGGRFGATEQGIDAAVADAAKSFDRGGNIAAARKAGLGTIGRLTDTQNIEKQISQDPLSKLLGVEALPDVSPAEIAQDRAPQVLTATINNTFTIDLNFGIDGAARPDLIPDQVLDAFRAMFRDEVQAQTKYAKVPFAR